jgi:hypothetical protein
MIRMPMINPESEPVALELNELLDDDSPPAAQGKESGEELSIRRSCPALGSSELMNTSSRLDSMSSYRMHWEACG